MIICDQSKTLIDFTNMDENGKKTAKLITNRISNEGSTNLAGGLFDGLKLIKKNTMQ